MKAFYIKECVKGRHGSCDVKTYILKDEINSNFSNGCEMLIKKIL